MKAYALALDQQRPARVPGQSMSSLGETKHDYALHPRHRELTLGLEQDCAQHSHMA